MLTVEIKTKKTTYRGKVGGAALLGPNIVHVLKTALT